jgi:RNA polymerase sigma factor (sigma-70 family)
VFSNRRYSYSHSNFAPIEYEYEYRFTEYEYEFDASDTGDQREVSEKFAFLSASRPGNPVYTLGERAMNPMQDFIRTLTRAQQGDENAIEEIFSSFAEDVRLTCLDFQLEQTADLSRSDLLQEAWVKIWVQLGRFQVHEDTSDAKQQFRVWLRHTARNEMISVLEKRVAKKRSPAKPIRNGDWLDEAQGNDGTPSRLIGHAEELTNLKSAVERLDATSRAVIEACFMDGCTVKAMADRLGLTYAEARNRLSKALDALRKDVNNSH